VQVVEKISGDPPDLLQRIYLERRANAVAALLCTGGST